MSKKRVAIAIPASFVSDTPHLREKTSKISLIGRAAAIFRIHEIILYPDNPHVDQRAEMELITKLLRYMETPQYLRKNLFKFEPDLRYAGVLPPLRTPHHPLNRRMKSLRIGEYREGVASSRTTDGTLVEVGVEQPVLLPNRKLKPRKRVTVKITAVGKQIEVELANRDEIPDYWGYTVSAEPHPLGNVLKRKCFGLTIATSRNGVSYAEIADEIADKWKMVDSVLVAFGAPSQGLKGILENEGLMLNETFDYVINTIPNQGTETVRTEEAILASLAALNLTAIPVKRTC